MLGRQGAGTEHWEGNREGKAGREFGMEVVELDPQADVEEAMPRHRSGPSPDSTPSGFGCGY